MNWETGTDVCALFCVKQIAGMCCISGSSSQCSVLVVKGGRKVQEGGDIYIYLTKPGTETRSPSSQANSLLSKPPGRILLPMQEAQEMQV